MSFWTFAAVVLYVFLVQFPPNSVRHACCLKISKFFLQFLLCLPYQAKRNNFAKFTKPLFILSLGTIHTLRICFYSYCLTKKQSVFKQENRTKYLSNKDNGIKKTGHKNIQFKALHALCFISTVYKHQFIRLVDFSKF